MSDSMTMQDQRVIVITGASSGIGEALAQRAAQAGYAVLAVGRNTEKLDALATSVGAHGGTIVTLQSDVRDERSARTIVEAAFTNFGRIDTVVANAGTAGRGPLVLQSEDELREQIETHLYAPLRLIREALPLLHVSKGSAFVLGSGVARVPINGMGLYPASKAAVRSAVRTLRRELRPLGVSVGYVDPGVVDTDFMKRKQMPGAPASIMVSPHVVARAILRGIAKRSAEVNASFWQTASVALSEMFPRVTDYILAHADGLTGVDGGFVSIEALPPADIQTKESPSVPLAPAQPTRAENAFSSALEPFRNRMERAKLPLHTLIDALGHEVIFSEDTFVLEWVGMPNKNERKLISDIAQALAEVGIVEKTGDRTWKLRSGVASLT